MKKILFPIALLLIAGTVFIGCDNDPPTPEYIVVEDNGTLNQTVYADEEDGASGVQIITRAPWTSSITETTATTSATRNADNWVSISPESGGIGTYTIAITLEPNFTGTDRSAVIAITSGGTIIRINITQQGITEEGEVPEEPAEPITEIRAENIIGDDFSEVATVRLSMDYWRDWYIEAPFVNNGFTLPLPETVPDNLLRQIDLSSLGFDYLTISDENAKEWRSMDDGIRAYNKDGRYIGLFRFEEKRDYISATWTYADRDVVIKGSHHCCCSEATLDLNLRKGWNIEYSRGIGRVWTTTTQKPDGMNLQWVFERSYCCCDHSFVVENHESLRQTVDEDAETGASTIRFNTPTPWTSSIEERPAGTRSSEVSWISISPESGNAGDYEITLTLEPNTAYYRAARITIANYRGTPIVIEITQRGPNGIMPPPVEPGWD